MKREQCLEMLLDLLEEGIHVIDSQGRTVIYNKKMEELEKMARAEVLGEELLRVFPSLNEESSNLMKTLRTGLPATVNQQDYYNKFGQQITTMNSTYPLNFEDGSRYALEISRDITLIRELYKQIIGLQNRLYRNPTSSSRELEHYEFSHIIGEDFQLQKMIAVARKAAVTDSPVLIYGKTGTGKELFAQGIHYANRKGAFIAQNCAALPEHLLEGILFGTRRGGFTGALNRKGLFQQASGGTLLLDEVNALPLNLQAKLLRVLEDGKIRPIGSEEEFLVEVRVIATMNTSPEEALKARELRRDLYYRLAVVYLQIPSLKERPGDIPLLVNHFIHFFNKKYQMHVKGLSKEVENLFSSHLWPGNVRQLKHVIEGSMNLMDDEGYIEKKHLGPLLEIGEEGLSKMTLQESLAAAEKERIEAALEESGGNISHAANRLGLKRQSLQYRLKKYGI